VGDQDQFPFLTDLDIPPEWEGAAHRFVESGGIVMVLGAPGTGKSTLCRYLVHQAYVAGKPVALVDLDLGQTHLGPPATLGLGLFPPRLPGDEGVTSEAIAFIGQTSPLGAILEVVVGCRALVDRAHSRGYPRVVVNTSGLVQGTGALILKRAQVELLQPSLILGLQRHLELEPLLRGLGGCASSKGSFLTPPPLVGREWGEGEITPTLTLPHQGGGNRETSGWPIHRLPVSCRTVRRGPEERRSYREARFRRYFQGAHRLEFPWRRLVWDGQPWGHGEPLSPEILDNFRRTLVVSPLYGESQGRRAMLLLPEAPKRNNQENSREGQPWDQVRWLTWPSLHWRLVGLLDGRRRTLALGLILPGAWDPKILALFSPLVQSAIHQVRFLKVGKLRVNLRGQELSHV
jgi:polynucleotide 5'-hydroxyl-kinase GRC3/NOL9